MTQIEMTTVAASMMLVASAGLHELDKTHREMMVQVDIIKESTCRRITGNACHDVLKKESQKDKLLR